MEKSFTEMWPYPSEAMSSSTLVSGTTRPSVLQPTTSFCDFNDNFAHSHSSHQLLTGFSLASTFPVAEFDYRLSDALAPPIDQKPLSTVYHAAAAVEEGASHLDKFEYPRSVADAESAMMPSAFTYPYTNAATSTTSDLKSSVLMHTSQLHKQHSEHDKFVGYPYRGLPEAEMLFNPVLSCPMPTFDMSHFAALKFEDKVACEEFNPYLSVHDVSAVPAHTTTSSASSVITSTREAHYANQASDKMRIGVADCQVCQSTSANGIHFGARTCAACAAFFRRTISDNKKYVCKRSQRCTNASRDGTGYRKICRSCRMKRCIEIGMLPENVQHKRVRPQSPVAGSSSTTPAAAAVTPRIDFFTPFYGIH